MKGSYTKQTIIRTAIDLFGRRGYSNVSMRDIAEQVGIRAGSLYHHFESKEAILAGAIDDAASFLSHLMLGADTILEMLRRLPPYQILKKFVTYYSDEDDTYRLAIYRLLFMEMYGNPRILGIVHDHFILRPVKNLTYVMEVMAEAGAIPASDYLAIAELWSRTSLIYGFMAAHDSANVSWTEYDAMTDFFIEMAVRGVRTVPLGTGGGRGAPQPDGAPVQPLRTRELILHRALDLFSRHGYASVSVRQIAAAAGIKPGSIYNHFTGKERIMQEMVDFFLVRAPRHDIADAVAPDRVESGSLEGIIGALSRSCAPAEHPAAYQVYRVLFREQYANPALGKLFLDTLQQEKQAAAAAIDRLVSQRVIPPCDSWKLAVAYIHTMRCLSIGSTMEEQTAGEEALRPRVTAQLIGLILYGYRTKPGGDAGMPSDGL